MEEVYKLIIGIIVLGIGLPLGNLLASATKEELKSGKKWFKILIILSLAGGFVGLIINNDFLMFSFFFIAIVTSLSLKNGKSKKIRK